MGNIFWLTLCRVLRFSWRSSRLLLFQLVAVPRWWGSVLPGEHRPVTLFAPRLRFRYDDRQPAGAARVERWQHALVTRTVRVVVDYSTAGVLTIGTTPLFPSRVLTIDVIVAERWRKCALSRVHSRRTELNWRAPSWPSYTTRYWSRASASRSWTPVREL